MAPFDPSVITKAGDSEAVPGLLKKINLLAGKEGDEARQDMKDLARDLFLSLETPREAMIRQCWAEPAVLTAIVSCHHKGIWQYLVENEDKGPFNATEVAKVKSIDPPIIRRMMKHLGSMGYLKEIAKDTYTLTNHTRSLSVPIIGDPYPCMTVGCFGPINNFHVWADQNDWKTPSGPVGGPLQLAYNTELNFFEHLQNVGVGEQFNSMMGGYHQGRPSWMDANFYPVQERLFDGFEKDNKEAALIVDIGGNVGHDLEEFGRKHPEAPGRLVLQDLPVIIGQIKRLDDRIERMEYDFYTEQPVKGARAYFMHSVLHDWSDDICLKILANIVAAMKPGYSKLLINENIIPDTGAHSEHTALDMMMITLLSSKERTRADWEELLSQAGLKISGVYTVARNAESLIECELVEGATNGTNGTNGH